MTPQCVLMKGTNHSINVNWNSHALAQWKSFNTVKNGQTHFKNLTVIAAGFLNCV